jgi:hypothetical protein
MDLREGGKGRMTSVAAPWCRTEMRPPSCIAVLAESCASVCPRRRRDRRWFRAHAEPLASSRRVAETASEAGPSAEAAEDRVTLVTACALSTEEREFHHVQVPSQVDSNPPDC